MKQTNRIYYLDYLKVLMIIFVIMVHAAITFGGVGGWYYREAVNFELAEYLFTLFNAIQQTYFMGFFFFISGYFTPRSYDKKGAKLFLKERFIRLGIPLAVFYFILNPICGGLAYPQHMRILDSILNMSYLGPGPLWFVQALLIFSLIYSAIRELGNKNTVNIKFPNTKTIVITLLLAGVANFIIRIFMPVGESILGMQFAHFPMYIILFPCGVIANRSNWLSKLSKINSLFWNTILILLIIIFIALMVTGTGGNPDNFMSGLRWQSLFYSTWEPFVGTAIIFNLLLLFERKFNFKSNIGLFLSQNAYSVYILHAPVLIYTSVQLKNWDANPFTKFFIAVGVTSVVCYIISYLLRKIPGVKKVL